MKLRKPTINNTFLLSLSALILGTVLAFGLQIIFAWVGPTAQPPQSNISELLHTGPQGQNKIGPLSIEGGLTVGTPDNPQPITIHGGLSLTDILHGDNTYAYFQDVQLLRANKLAGDPFIYSYNCQWISGTDCGSVTLSGVEGDNTEQDKGKYVLVGVNTANGQIRCCRPPAVAPVPPSSPMIVVMSIEVVGAGCSAGSTLYQGKVTVKVNYYDPDTGESLDAVPNAIVRGSWVSPTTLCADGGTSCSTRTNADGIATIFSMPLIATDSYGKTFQFQITSVKHASDFVQVYNPSTKQVSVYLANPGQPMNIHLASLSVISEQYYLVDAFHRYALAKVKVVNEAGKPVPGLTVIGRWSGSYSSTTDETAVSGEPGVLPSDYIVGTSPAFENDVVSSEDGIAKFVTQGVYCWQEFQSGSQKLNFTFTVRDVNTTAQGCPSYNGVYNYCYPATCCSPSCLSNPPAEKKEPSICLPPDIVYWPFGPDPHYWAWGENVGWLKFKSTKPQEGTWEALISRGCLEGYIWAENIGWINLGDGSPRGVANGCQYTGATYANDSATDFGVNNDGYGNLCGYAWGENVGWINFGAMKVDGTCDLASTKPRVRVFVDSPTTAKLQGYAWGENIGWIKFDYDTTLRDYNPWIMCPGTKSPGESCSSNSQCSSCLCLGGICK